MQGPTQSILIRRFGDLSMRDDRTQSQRIRTYLSVDYRLTVSELPSGILERMDLVPRHPEQERGVRRVPLKPPQYQTVLGERCQVFDMAPGVMDYSNLQCLTKDGLTLSERTGGWGSSYGGSAARLARRTLVYADLAPPADILTGKWTGLGALKPIPLKPKAITGPSTQSTPLSDIRYTVPQWVKAPTPKAMSKYYPSKAYSDEVEGLAVLDCQIGAGGSVIACSVISESPRGYGFGQATIAFLKGAMQMKPGTYKANDHIKSTLKWTLSDTAADPLLNSSVH
ncbi:hypothetical protein MMA231_04295 (plasmid) [Asticcacaulis sp. MM231]|uniref:energy transducer TonB n=1 Tax=Asticcacaulis sp. MM231 TaxID=3157666 RepID=UPI0032D570FE